MENTIPSWDLRDLYQSVDDPNIERDLVRADEWAKQFSDTYRDKIRDTNLDSTTLAEALHEYTELTELLYKVDAYADLLFSADTSNTKNADLMQSVAERISRISTLLIFFTLELGQISDTVWQRLQNEAELSEYRHIIEQARLEHKYSLSEPEEKVLEETANCRGRAFSRLFTETVSRLKFPVEMDGEVKELSQSELSALMYHPDRELRKRAAESLSEVLQANIHPLHFCYSMIILEKLTMDRLRGFEYPEQDRHISNELPAAAIETMTEVVVKNYPTVSRYYDLKKQLLGVDTLFHYDRYAPLPPKEKGDITFEQAKTTVLQAFGEFSPLFRETAQKFFDQGWIDAALRPGKRGGAFCAGITPKLHPYVLMNFTGTARDVETLAHELGHGIHDVLASKQNLLNYHPVLPLAETASTFAELIVFHKLLKELPDAGSKLALVAEHLESLFATVFRQTAMYRFEQRVFRQRSQQGEVSAEQMSDIWQECLQAMFADSLTLGEDHRNTWCYVPHFVHTPFYVYAYSFGELLVLSLYARYRQEGKEFQDRYFELLASGSSASPQEMLSRLNIDITSAEFWQGGCDLIAEEVEEAECLAAEYYDPYNEPDEPDASAGWGAGDDDGWDGSDEEEIGDRLDW